MKQDEQIKGLLGVVEQLTELVKVLTDLKTSETCRLNHYPYPITWVAPYTQPPIFTPWYGSTFAGTASNTAMTLKVGSTI